MKKAYPKQSSTSPENALNEQNMVALFQLNPTAMWIRDEAADTLLALNQAALALLDEQNQDKLLGKRIDFVEIIQTAEDLIIIKKNNASKLFKRSSLPIIWNGEKAKCDYILPHTLAGSAIQDFQNAVDKASIVSLANKVGVITYVNENFVKISGYSSDELIGQNHRIINSAHHPKSFWADMWKTISSGKTWRAEVKNKAKDGSYYWVDTFIMPFLDEKGHIKEFLSIRNDITNRKSAEEALVDSRNKLSEALQFGNMGGALFYLDTQVVDLSIELLKLLEIDTKERIQISLLEFMQKHVVASFHGLIQEKIEEGFKKASLEPSKLVVEFEMITATQKIIKIEAKGIFKDSRAIGIFHNVTDRVEAQNEIFKRGRIIDNIFKGIDDGFFALDHQFNFILVNPTFMKMAKMKEQDMLGKSIIDLFPFIKDAEPYLFYQKVLATQQADQLILINWFNEEQFFQVNAYPNPEGLFVHFKDISEAKKSERLLVEREQNFKTIFNESPLGIGVIDSHTGHICQANPMYSRIVGRCVEELTQVNWMSITHPDDIQPDLNNLAEMNAGKTQGFQMEKRFIKPDGSVVWISMSIAKLKTEDGASPRHLCMIKDITRRKASEEEIKKLSLIASNTHSSVVFTDVDGYITWVNKGFEKLTEYNLDEVKGKKPGQFLQGRESNQQVIDKMSNCLKSGKFVNVEIINYTKLGKKYWIDIEIMPMHNEQGVLTGFMSVQTDISALKEATEEALSARNQLQTIMDHAPMVVFMKDAQGKYLLFNKMYKDFIGKELPLGITDYEIFDTDFADACKLKDNHVLTTGEIISFEHFVGNQTFFETKFPIRDESGEIYALGGMSVDITSLKRLEDQVKEQEYRFQNTAKNLPNGVVYQFEIDADGIGVRFTYVSQGAEKLFEASIESILENANLLFDLVHKDDLERISNGLLESMKTLSPFSDEHRVVLKNNKTLWILSQAMPRRKADGGTIWDGIAIDITKTKKLELALKASEAKLQNIFQSMISGVVVVDTRGEITYANKSASDILSLEPEEIEHKYFAPKNWKQVDDNLNPFPPENLPLGIALTKREHVSNLEHGIMDSRGNVKWLSVNAAPLVDESGNFIGAVASFVDITKRRESERQLNETLLRLNVIANNIPNGAIYQFSVNKMGKFSFPFMSEAIYSILGIKATDLMQNINPLLERAHPEDIPKYIAAVEYSKENLTEFHCTCRFKNNEDEYRYIAGHSKPRLLPDGTVIWDGVLMDDTESWELMDSLEKTHSELEELLLEKDVLIREIHHRVKNNLQVMSSVLFLKAQTLKEPEMRQLLIESRQRLRSMAIIHERLMQSGGKITKVDIHDYLISLVEELKNAQLVNIEDIQIALDIEHEMLNLEQVVNCGFIINEAVTNSLKYAFPEGRKGIIGIQFKIKKEAMELVISDNGVGLPPHASLDNTELFGMQLIKVFTNHLHGKVTVDGIEGTIYTIRF